MILTANEIAKNVSTGQIVLSPFDKNNLGTISYKFRINNKISPIYGPLDSKQSSDLCFEDMPETGYVLEPGVLYLAQTYEVMGAHDYAQQIFALRDVGSTGIFIHISADLGHSGAITQWTLEITTDHRIKLYPYQLIGQMVFWKLTGNTITYNGDYQNMPHSLPGKQWKEFRK
ncbi:MAG: deoxycytidine triphosphate deaminase [bacterium]